MRAWWSICSPGGAAVDSQGREPLGRGALHDIQPRRGGGAVAPTGLWGCPTGPGLQGLTPLAIDRRPSGAKSKGRPRTHEILHPRVVRPRSIPGRRRTRPHRGGMGAADQAFPAALQEDRIPAPRSTAEIPRRAVLARRRLGGVHSPARPRFPLERIGCRHHRPPGKHADPRVQEHLGGPAIHGDGPARPGKARAVQRVFGRAADLALR